MSLFHSKEVKDSTTPQDIGKIKDIDQHKLLHQPEKNDQLSFHQVQELGKLFLEFAQTELNTVLPFGNPELQQPQQLLTEHFLQGNKPFWGKLMFSKSLEDQFPATASIEKHPSTLKYRIKLYIVPIPFDTFEKIKYQTHSEGLVSLAAVSAVAPQFPLDLESGVSTTKCSTKKEVVTTITPDHGAPLAAVFDSFHNSASTLTILEKATGNQSLAIKKASHLHGQTRFAPYIATAASTDSKLAGGVRIRTVYLDEITEKNAFLISTLPGLQDISRILSIEDFLHQKTDMPELLSLMAVALGFTSQAVGKSERIKKIEQLLNPDNTDISLKDLVRNTQ